MHYKIHYVCTSHIGNVRSVNQDNFICDKIFFENGEQLIKFPLCGTKRSTSPSLFGVFDGMGGEEHGEIASYLAATVASELKLGKNPIEDLSKLCNRANEDICEYTSSHKLSSMGTTAAMLAFTKDGVSLCNIGDSKIFQLSDNELKQISTDHTITAAYGTKPLLLQNLGIPPTEMIIEPYFAQGTYKDGDIFLICSDGLTDEVSTDDIAEVLSSKPIVQASQVLLEKALSNKGNDNITFIICKIERYSFSIFNKKRCKNVT